MGRSSRQKLPETPRRNWPVAGLAAAGLIVAGYLALTKLGGESPLFCTAGSGCDIVQASRYAVFFGLPTALWGTGLYAAIGALALMGLDARRWLAAFLLAVVGVSFFAYLTYLELFEIGAVCSYCVLSSLIMVALFGLLLAGRSSVVGRRSAVRPGRIATLGTITAVVTILVGAGYFAGDSSHAAGYQEALARHLSDSGAIMYGAYW
ncbi:MAG: vitamin K epoxide reductase family protein [Candidatus Methylomirabilales bacterium]